jgi:hypothetical protein
LFKIKIATMSDDISMYICIIIPVGLSRLFFFFLP